jgi:hypothetical protein
MENDAATEALRRIEHSRLHGGENAADREGHRRDPAEDLRRTQSRWWSGPGFTFAPEVVPVMVTAGLTASRTVTETGPPERRATFVSTTDASMAMVEPGAAAGGIVKANDSVRVDTAGSNRRVVASAAGRYSPCNRSASGRRRRLPER